MDLSYYGIFVREGTTVPLRIFLPSFYKTLEIQKSWHFATKNLDYSRVKANPPHPNIKVEEVADDIDIFYE